MSVLVWTAVVVIGGAGSLLRFYADGLVSAVAGRDFPLGTMVINVSGAVVLGLLSGLALSSSQYLLLGTAAVGSYTTFSTWMLETQRLTEERQHRKAVLNIVVSLALGIAAAALGRLIGISASASGPPTTASRPMRCSTCTGSGGSRPASCCAESRGSAPGSGSAPTGR